MIRFCVRFGILLLFSVLHIQSIAQELGYPAIKHFFPKDYKAFTQNWQIEQSDDGLVWVANNSGIISFDGNIFQVYQNKNSSIVRSFARSSTDTIWVGSVSEIGFLSKNESGFYTYQSIETDSGLVFSDVWKTFAIPNGAIFFSIERYWVFQNGKLSSYASSPYSMPQEFGKSIWHLDINKGFSVATSDSIYNLESTYGFDEDSFAGIVQTDGLSGYVLTTKGDVYAVNLSIKSSVQIRKVTQILRGNLSERQTYSLSKLGEEGYAVATLGSGILQFDKNWKLVRIFDSKHGLPNDIITSLFYKNGVLWYASDNGFGKIPIHSPITQFNIKTGLEGRVESFIIEHNQFYAGGFTGLYEYDFKSKLFAKVEDENHSGLQVWDIKKWNNEIVIATQNGIVKRTKSGLKSIYSEYYVRSMLPIQNYLITGLGGAIAVLSPSSGILKQHHLYKEFETDVIGIYKTEDDIIWIKTALNQLYRAKWINAKQELAEIQQVKSLDGLPTEQVSDVAIIGNTVYVLSENSVLKWDENTHQLKLINEFPKLEKLFELNGELWGIQSYSDDSERLQLLRNLADNPQVVSSISTLPESFVTSVQVLDSVIYIGSSEGIYSINTAENESNRRPSVYVSGIQSDSYNVNIGFIDNGTNLVSELPFLTNNAKISFHFRSVDFISPEFGTFQYQLIPLNNSDEWLPFEEQFVLSFSNLTWNDYSLRVRYTNAYGDISDVSQIQFAVQRPWYFSFWGIGLWILVLSALMSGFVSWRSEVIKVKEQKKAAFDLEQERQKAALREAELKAEMIERESKRKTDELEEARKIQQTFLAQSYPKSNYVSFAATQETASEVGGDYYDFFSRPNGVIVAAVGDATGHGVGAGLMVSATKASLLSINNDDLLEISAQLNKVLKQVNRHRRLNMALMLAEFIPLSETEIQVDLCGGGMPPVIIVRMSGDVEEIIIEGLPFGVMGMAKYERKTIKLYKNDVLILFSDGLPERPDKQDIQLGYEEMMTEFKKLADLYIAQPEVWTSENILKSIIDFSNLKAQNAPLDDDLTLLVAKIL
ncbi:hypothetical protein EP331_09030 [bacterium]|nr:MAG: hypothetical protein EP331_09030 [bacterium]